MSKKKTNKRNKSLVSISGNKVTVKVNQLAYKMDSEELEKHLHLRRKGSSVGKDKTKFSRKDKHKRSLLRCG